MTFSASHLTYLLLCHRKLWLHHRQMRMEDNSSDVATGKLVDRTSYRRRARRWRQLSFDNVKIDHFDPKEKVVKETKKSPKLEYLHVAQVKYYLYLLEQRGVQGVSGLIEYPRQKRSTEVELDHEDWQTLIPSWIADIQRVTQLDNCPEVVDKPVCRKCAFHDFCYS